MNEILTAIEVIIASMLGSALSILLPLITFLLIFGPIAYLIHKWEKKYQKTPRMKIEKNDVVICLLLFAIKPLICLLYYCYLLQQHNQAIKNNSIHTAC